ncbi:FG-GAP-like repeat-containing protein [Bacteroidota bacterium]
MKHKLAFLFIILIFGIIQTSKSQPNFSEYIISGNTHGAGGIHTCDIDGDSDNDVLVASLEDDEIIWFENRGETPIIWAKHIIGENVYNAHSVYASDIDNDGDLDIVGAAYEGFPGIAWWQNDGGDPIVWTKYTIAQDFINAHEIYIGDLDLDGDFDVLGASSYLNTIAWWKNEGGDPILWQEQLISDSVTLAKSVHIGDLDGDSDLDVVGVAITEHDIIWWRNEGGNPIQWTEFMVDPNFGGAHRVQCIDMDFDNDIDILCAGYLGHEVAWWRNEGGENLSWTKHIIGSNVTNACIAQAVDLDNDHDLDVIATAQGDNEVVWWSNEGDSSTRWRRHLISDYLVRPWPLAISDLDNDGDLDVVSGSSHQGSNEIMWWENQLYYQHFDGQPRSGHMPLVVSFEDFSSLPMPIISREWDFDDDGVIDYTGQNTDWTYNTPGIYAVNLNLVSDSITIPIYNQEYISVFDGESALEFNDISSSIICNQSPNYSIAGNFSIEAWVKPYSFGSNNEGRIFDKTLIKIFTYTQGFHSNTDSCLVVIMQHESGEFSKFSTPSGSIKLDTWQHIAFTYSSEYSEAHIYIDGVDQELNYLLYPEGEITDNQLYNIYLGNSSNEINSFAGIIDELRLWNSTRTPSQINSNMNNSLDSSLSNLVGYWKMDEGYGSIVYDLTNENTGIIANTKWCQGLNFGPVLNKYEEIHSYNQEFEIYPIPAYSEVNIKFNSMEDGSLFIEMFDLNGRIVKRTRKNIQIGQTYNIEIDTKNISNGIYYIKLFTLISAKVKKVVIQN